MLPYHNRPAIFKFTLPWPQSHSLLLLNRLRSSQWHHNSRPRPRRGHCSLSFITAHRDSSPFRGDESDDPSRTCFSFIRFALVPCTLGPHDTKRTLHYITWHHMSFSRRFYPKRLTISAFNREYKLRTTRIQEVTFPQHSRTTKVPQ